MKIEMIEKKFPQHFFAQVELSRGSTAPFKNHQGGPDFNKQKRVIGGGLHIAWLIGRRAPHGRLAAVVHKKHSKACPGRWG